MGLHACMFISVCAGACSCAFLRVLVLLVPSQAVRPSLSRGHPCPLLILVLVFLVVVLCQAARPPLSKRHLCLSSSLILVFLVVITAACPPHDSGHPCPGALTALLLVVVLLVLLVVVVPLVFPTEVVQFVAMLELCSIVVAMLHQMGTQEAVPTEWVQAAQETMM